MTTKFRNLKNDLKDLEKETNEANMQDSSRVPGGNTKTANYILLFAFIATLLFYVGSRIDTTEFSNPIGDAVESFTSYSPELLEDMGDLMEDLGYGFLSNEELSDLRDEGVTATETSQFLGMGYTDLTLDDMVALKNDDVSARYATMMQELGYDLTLGDLMETRRNGVTAYSTSRLMDLGYTLEDLPKENLIRLSSVGVDEDLAEELMRVRGELVPIDELIRYRISNQ